MDVFIAEEALVFLKAIGALPGEPHDGGYLIGHIQGRRYIVEKAFPAGGDLARSLPRFHEINRIFGSRIIGFFEIRPDETSSARLLNPVAYGKIFLDVRFTGLEKMSIKPFVVDYRDDFYFSPIRLRRRSSRRA